MSNFGYLEYFSYICTMKKLVRKYKVYTVDWYRNGFCYRTTTDCDWEAVKDCRRAAKLMGETIKYEFDHYKEYTYLVR